MDTRTNGPATDKVKTVAERVAQCLRDDIVEGQWVPQARLAMVELRQRYSVSMSPLREALNRLAGEGLVQCIGQRGFRVPALDLQDIQDLTALRVIAEEAALRQVLAHADAAWAGRIEGAFKRLRDALDQLHDFQNPTRVGLHIYEEAHRKFHASFYEGGLISPRLAKLQRDLYDQALRYRKTLHAAPNNNVRALEVHRHLMEAVLGGHPEVAVSALTRHLQTTLEATSRALTAQAQPRPESTGRTHTGVPPAAPQG